MEIRILRNEEIKAASGLSRYVFDYCLRNRINYPQTIAYVEEYISEENMLKLCEACELILWGAFEGEELVAVSGLQRNGLITLLYVLPQHHNKGYGSRLLNEMRIYAKSVCDFSKVTVNANPAWTSGYFAKMGFRYMNAQQDMRVPFISMYAQLKQSYYAQKRPVSKRVIALAIAGGLFFATVAGSLYMITYLF